MITQSDQPVIPQYGLWTILFMFAWPAVWYSLVIYGLGSVLAADTGSVPTWFFFLVIVLGGGAEGIVALILLRREGYALSYSALKSRLRLQWPKGWTALPLALAIIVVAFPLTMAMMPLNLMLTEVPGFVPPDWMVPVLDPRAEITQASDAFPDIALPGNYLFWAAFFFVTLIFNLIGEEIYYRGVLLPRMNGVFGKWDWVANGVLFTLKHAYQRWLYPSTLIGGLAFAFAMGPMKSLPLAVLFHWIGGYLMSFVALTLAVFGG